MERFRSGQFLVWTGVALMLAGVGQPARAQDPDDMQRGVARISLMNGEVNVRRGDSGEWVAGVINAPLLTDDRIATAPNSRAEVQFDAANMLRLGGNAEIHLTQLEANRYQMELARGTVTFRVLRPSTASVEVDTPSVSVRPSKQGIYRITVSEAGETEVTSRAGEVEVFTPHGSQWVNAGQTMMARGNSSDPEFQIVNAGPVDDWDRWNDMRDRAMMQSNSYQYVGPGVYGAEDLDNYGSWVDVPQYGNVWRPTVGIGPDWAPYSSGRWVWEDWYGWTWVSYDPWGWAPYHYGRWFWQTGFGWCWYPGGLGIRHYWSPALVAFFGFGHGVGFGFGFGNVGWVPLAPYEVFHPWWGRGFYGRGFDRINITNVNVTNVYRNARVMHGISAVNANDFRNGRFGSISRVSGDQVREAGLVRGQMPIAPSRSNLQFSNRTVSNVPRTNENARFFTHQQPSAVSRVPFAQQQRSMGVSGGQAPGGQLNSAAQGGPRGGAGNMSAQTRDPGSVNRGGSTTGPGSSGWRRFGEPAGPSGSSQNMAPRNDGNNFRSPAPNNRSFENTRPPSAGGGSGWQRFGEPGGNSRQPSAQPRSSYQGGNGSTYNTPRYNAPAGRESAPSNSAPRSYSAPSYSGQRGSGAPSYSAPQQHSAPSYSAPRSYSAPSYSAPRGGGGGGSRPSGGGGGGGHSSGGGGGHSGGGGGGGGHHR